MYTAICRYNILPPARLLIGLFLFMVVFMQTSIACAFLTVLDVSNENEKTLSAAAQAEFKQFAQTTRGKRSLKNQKYFFGRIEGIVWAARVESDSTCFQSSCLTLIGLDNTQSPHSTIVVFAGREFFYNLSAGKHPGSATLIEKTNPLASPRGQQIAIYDNFLAAFH